MAINFPDSPSNGDTHTVGDKTWTWDGTSWNVVTAASGDHGNLAGLSDDDHTQYLRVDGTRSADSLTVSDDFTVDTDTLHVDSTNDRVGIGTTTPNDKVTVSGSVTAVSRDADGSTPALSLSYHTGEETGYIETWQSKPLRVRTYGNQYFNTNGTDRVTINTSGNVGINDTTPSYTLDVNGDINATDDLLVAGGSVGRGLRGYIRTATDFNLTTTLLDIGSVTFTLDSNRLLLIGFHFPLIDARSTTNFVTGYVNSGAGLSGTTYCYAVHYGVNSTTINGWRVTQFPAGTYTVYLTAGTNTGTARINGAGGGARYTGMFVLDVGGY